MRQLHGRSRGTRWQHKVLAIAVASCFAGDVALANPTGPAVAQGQASIATQGNTLTVTNSPGAVINWQGFSIAGNEITRFIQQSQSSSVLNRVVGVNPSAILGTLQSNGRVFLINPNGITVGPGANIDVAGFLASTLNLSDSDFIAGRMRFTETPGAGSVVNQGTITTATGGMVYLVGQDVKNSGIIRSPQGEIMLAAGKSVELVDAQTPEVRVQITAPENQALNVGQLIADGGRIGMYGTLVQNSGVVNANTAVMGENGKIVFKAVKDVTLEAGSVTTANGPDGGSVTAQAETGTLLASGTIEAKGESGKGGTVHLLGNQVGVIGNANVDVSGGSGGGTVLVGGDFQGSNPEVQNAARTFVGQDARIVADATEAGDGGKVIVWADSGTRYHGKISARGGLQSGDGGFAEVSGKNMLIYRGTSDLSAPAGSFGTLLLDPRDITIQASGSNDIELDAGIPVGEVFGQVLFGAPTSTDFTLTAATVSATNANVVLQAQRDISINAPVTMQDDRDFVAQAGRDINVNAALTTNGVSAGQGRIHLEADSPHSGTFFDGVGQVKIGAAVNSCGGAAGGCAGGNITLIGGGNSSPNGGFNLDSTVQAGNGGLNVALSQTTAALDFFIGAGGNTQLSSNDAGSLKTTGALVLGRAATAGSDGMGSGALTLTVDSITNATAAPMQLSADSGGSFELYAGSGGITLDRPLTAYQDTVIDTTGALTINQTLATSDNDLTLTVGSVVLGSSGSVNIGSGSCAGLACSTLGVASTQVYWDGEGLDYSWFTAANWSNNQVPSSTQDVTIDTTLTFGTIVIAGGAAQAKSLLAGRPIVLSSGTLDLTNASNFADALTFSGGTLQGTGGVAVSGSNGSLAWSGGTMASGGTFLLGSGRSGTLSGNLSLNRLFQNDGVLTLNTAVITGAATGSITNNGTLTATGTNSVPKMLLALGSIDGLGSLTVADWSRTGGVFNMAGTASLQVPSGNFAVDQAYTAGSLTLLAPAGDIVLNAAVTGTAASGTTVTLAGNNFINNVGSSAVDAGAGRWLVYSTDPASNMFGPVSNLLSSGNQAIWGRSYPTAVAELGNRYVFANTGAVTVTTTDATKTYGDAPINLSTNFTLTGKPVDAAAYGNVYLNSTVGDIFSVGPTIVSTGNTAIANVGGGGGFGGAYSITSTGTANAGYSLTSTDSGLLTVGTRAVTVTGDNQSRVYGDANPTLTYTVAADGVGASRGLANGDSLSGVLATTAVVTSNVGNYATTQGTLTDGNNSNYAITYNDGNLAVGTRAVTVTGDNQSRVYGDANPTLTYTVAADGVGASRGLANGDSLSGVLATTAVVTSNVGNYATTQGTLTDGNNSNYAITYNDGNLAVGTRAVTVTGDNQSRVYGDANPTLTYTVAADGVGASRGLANGDSLSGVLATTAVVTSNVGNYATTQGTLTDGNNSNYAITYNDGNLAVGTRAVTVTGDNQSRVYGDANPTLTYTVAADGVGASRGLANSDSLSGVLATTAVVTSNVGNYATTQGTLTDGNNSNYAITYNDGNLAVGTRAVTVTGDNQSRVYGDANPTLTYTVAADGVGASRGLANGDSLSGVLATTAVVTSNVGNYATTQGTLTDGNNSNYAITYNDGNLAVGTRAVTVTGDNQSRVYGDANPTLTYTVAADGVGASRGLANGDSLSGVLATTAVVTSNVGNYATTQGTLTDGNNSNYAITYNDGNLAVGTRAVTVTGDNQSRVYGDANPTLTYTVAADGVGASRGLANGDSLSGVLATTAVVTSNVGNYATTQGTLTDGNNSNYAITYNDGNLAVNPAIISLAGNRAYDGGTIFGSGAFGAVSGVNGETLSVVSGSGTVASAKALAGTQSLAYGSLALGNGYGAWLATTRWLVAPIPVRLLQRYLCRSPGIPAAATCVGRTRQTGIRVLYR